MYVSIGLIGHVLIFGSINAIIKITIKICRYFLYVSSNNKSLINF